MVCNKMKNYLATTIGIFIAIIIILIMSFVHYSYELKDKDIIPKSTIGKTFISLNIQHCADTYNNQCYIFKSELDNFKKNNNWKSMLEFSNNYIIWR